MQKLLLLSIILVFSSNLLLACLDGFLSRDKKILLLSLEACYWCGWTTGDTYFLGKHPPLALLVYVGQKFFSNLDQITVLKWQLVTWSWSSMLSRRVGWVNVGALPSLAKTLSTLERSKRKAGQAWRQRGYYCCQRLNEAAWLMPIWEYFSLNLAFLFSVLSW